MKCKGCGCTDGRACTGGCSWVKSGWCSKCVLSPSKAKKLIDVSEKDLELKSYGFQKFLVVKK